MTFQLLIIAVAALGLCWMLMRQRPPLRSIERNVVLNAEGEAWAVYGLPTEGWRLASAASQESLSGKLAGLSEGLQRDFRILRIHKALDGDAYRRQMESLCDPETGHKEMWKRRTDLHCELLEFRETFRPAVYLVVKLNRQADKAESAGVRMRRWLALALAAFIPRSVPIGFSKGVWRDENAVFRQVRQLGGDQASTGEIEFLIRRNATRGLGDPTCDEFWAPQAMRVDVENQTDQPESQTNPFKASNVDCLRLFDNEIERVPDERAIKINSELGVSYQAAFALGAIPELPLEEADVLSGWLDHVPFPVDVVFDAKYQGNKDALRKLDWKARKIAGIWEEEYESNALGPSAQTEQLPGLAKRLKGYLEDHSRPPLIEATTLFYVYGRSLEQVNDRADQVIEVFDPIKLHRPVDQIQAHIASLPGGVCKTVGYESPYKVEQIPFLAPTASPEGGSHGGPYIGNTRTQTALPVFLDIAEAPATDQTPTIFLLSEQGGGKTVTMQYLTLWGYEIGSQIVDIDPKGTGAHLDGADHKLITAPGVNKDDFEIVEFSPDGMQRGLLDPLRIAPADSKEDAAVSFYSSLIGEQGGIRETKLRQAVQHVLGEGGERYATGYRVIDWLNRSDDVICQELGDMLAVRADSTLARVGFAKSSDEVEDRGNRQVVTLRLREIPIPSPDVPIDKWDAQDREGEGILKLIMTYGLRLTAGSPAHHKIFSVDEFHAFDAQTSSGYRLLTRVNRLARSMNITPILASQRVSDVERLRGLVGAVMLFRLRDDEEITKGLELLGLDPQQQSLRETVRRELGGGACLFKGYDGRVCEMQVDLADDELLAALSTTPERRRRTPATG